MHAWPWKKWKRSPSRAATLSRAGPLRAEIFSQEQLEAYAREIASASQVVSKRCPCPLLERLADNEAALRAYNLSTFAAEKKRTITPAAEWLLDNFYLIKEQMALARRHLPITYSRQLPCLVNGPMAGCPRVYDLALELISHIDGRVTMETLSAFVAAYQTVKVLTLGELWAIPIMLRLALIENVRRIADQLAQGRADRDVADSWVDRMIETAEKNPSDLIIVVSDLARATPALTSAFVTEFYRRLQAYGTPLQLARQWLEQRLAEHNLDLEEMIRSESQLQAADQVSVGNSISSLRALAAMDWRKFVESLSVVEQILRTDPLEVYARMDFQTRDCYRHVVEALARHARRSEPEVARAAVQLAGGVRPDDALPRSRHVGFYLIDRGRPLLEKNVGARPPLAERLRSLVRRAPLPFYLGAIALFTAGLGLWVLQPYFSAGLESWRFALFTLLVSLSLSQFVIAFVNWLATMAIPPQLLPRMDFSQGIPAADRTIVVVPTLLANAEAVDCLLERLEIHYLANRDRNVFFGLLTDLTDAGQSSLPTDEPLLRRAHRGVAALNEKYKNDRPCIFFLFHRPRRWNEREGIWMGWERKRGKLAEFNALLRGGPADRFSDVVGDLSLLPSIRYVITLDTDTQLPREAVWRLVGTMAHPLNRPRFDPARGRVCEGYGILQPRVAVSLPSANRSWFARLFAGEVGIDPYTRAVSDIYQDLFREGSFIGKGIYDVEAFEQSLGGRFPENAILSHDLLESCHARSGLVTDIEVYEDHPSRLIAEANRRHRWIRGDWQIAGWLLPWAPGPGARLVRNPLSGLCKWKIFDNLRRSLIPIALTVLLLWAWAIGIGPAGFWTLFVVVIVAAPGVVTALIQGARKSEDVPWKIHFRAVGASTLRQLGVALFNLTFLPFDALVSLDAISRALIRVLLTRRRMLEWQTASDSERAARTEFASLLKSMWVAPTLAAGTAVFLGLRHPSELACAGALLGLWLFSPAIAWWLSLPIRILPARLSDAQRLFLKKMARKTWRFFEVFVNQEENWLPPDNFQEHPAPIVASRTSPTNIGLGLLSSLAARDFGYLTAGELLERAGKTFATLDQLERYRGHFYNWYDTRTLKPLLPLYLSSVDSGNFAAHLLTFRQGLLELAGQPAAGLSAIDGIHHNLEVLAEAAAACPPHTYRMPALASAIGALQKRLSPALQSAPTNPFLLGRLIEDCVAQAEEITALARETAQSETLWWSEALLRCARAHRQEIEWFVPWILLPPAPGRLGSAAPPKPGRQVDELGALRGWLERIPTLAEAAHMEQTLMPLISLVGETAGAGPDSREGRWIDSLLACVGDAARRAGQRINQLHRLAQRSLEFAELDFRFLFDDTRNLFSIGFNASEHRMDSSFYDLLASEARLTSYVAIAQYQAGQDHWFALSRLVVAANGSPVLLSWSGSMFEYLMPVLVMPAYENTLLDETYKVAVQRQIAYCKARGVPWGISESGFNMTDAHSNYQYRAFGVPGLGLKRGLSEDLVIAPYASALALMVDPAAACLNLERLAEQGAQGAYGFYEAIDYTPSRLRPGQKFCTVRSFMAHHQGMSLASLAYQLLDRPMQRRFQADPYLKSADLLLQERVPRSVTPLNPAELEAAGRLEAEEVEEGRMRVFTNPNAPAPEVHLLSNGRYHVMVSVAGGGYSRWKDTTLTRWQEDATRDDWGLFCYLRDLGKGELWSSAYQPTSRAAKGYEAVFTQGRAEFRRRSEDLDIHTQISVSPEDDVELRHMVLTNRSRDEKTIELTSYAEVVLTSPGADLAHPAFSNLFVESRILREQQALLCSRRPRSKHDRHPCLFHLMTVHGREAAEVSFETARSRFIGRGGGMQAPRALLEPGPLSNSEGAVLDPIVSIRRTVRLAPGQSVSVDLILGAGETTAQAAALVEKYQDRAVAERVIDLAWTHSGVVLRQLNITEADAQIFGRLAGSLLYAGPLRRASANAMQRNRRGQSSLWSYGISGDLPITLVHLSDASQTLFARQAVQAHAYWRLKGLQTEMVILTEDDSVYRQNLHEQVIGMVAASTDAHLLDRPAGIIVRNIAQVPEEDRLLLQSAARLVLSDTGGTLAEQAARRPRPEPVIPQLIPTRPPALEEPAPWPPPAGLLFFNSYGGFSADAKEYVTCLQPGQWSPAPWVNVLANPKFGTVISESGGAYTWAENAHEFRLTPWYNDPVRDVSGEAFYVRDEETGQFWSPTPLPARGKQPYRIRHGFGYSVFSHAEHGIESELTCFVAMDAAVKFACLKLRNVSGRRRRLSAAGYWEWVLGELRQTNLMHVITEVDSRTGALLARNSFNADFPGRVAFADVYAQNRTLTADRAEFIGRNGTLAQPAAMRRLRLSGKCGAALDPCAALQVSIDLADGQEHEIVFRLGVGRDAGETQHLIQRFRGLEPARKVLENTKDYWTRTLAAVQIETPDAALNCLANGWLLYQVLACRMWARSGFYQSGGAFGFRDQLQDSMALLHAAPDLFREHALLAAAHQFVEGDVQHWWHPPSDRGVRTHCSDDYLWLPYAVCHYVRGTGDSGILDELVPFLEGPPVKPGEEAYYGLPRRSSASATLYEHCARAINHGLRFGARGLPLIGSGDWNDGMNEVGPEGRGESVWLAFFLYDVLVRFAELANQRKDTAFASVCRSRAEQLRASIEKHAWDGHWYRRAYFDNGAPLGSSENAECRIDCLPQSWGIISRAADPRRAAEAMQSLDQHLVRRDLRLVQLLRPPFDKAEPDPGYIRGYVPGVRENGGQYTHAAVWATLALVLSGDALRAWELFGMINPILHSQGAEEADVYKVEPYVATADVYSAEGRAGRGGWSWYTGAAGWMYRLIVEYFLGIKREGDSLRFSPCLPADWKTVAARYRFRGTIYNIRLQAGRDWQKPRQVLLDGVPLPGDALPLQDDQREHRVEVLF